MTTNHPIEALLRPPVELSAAAVASICGVLAAVGPQWFLMTPSVGYGACVLLGAVAAWWFVQGLTIVRYQRNLRRLKRYDMSVSALPVSHNFLFLGKGFEWGERHTQRLHDTRRGRFQKYVAPHPLLRWVREHESQWEETFWYRLTRADSCFNPFRPLPDGGGITTLHGVELRERDITMPLADRSGHTLVLGTTRVGKSAALVMMARQDIARGDVVIVMDPKGDASILKHMVDAAAAANRPFYLFHLGYPDVSARYNSIGSFQRITEVAGRTAGQVSGEGSSAVFREFVWRFVNIVAKAVTALGRVPDYETILKHVTNIDDLLVEYALYLFEGDEVFRQAIAMKEAALKQPGNKYIPAHLKGRSPRLIAIEKQLVETGGGDDVLAGLRSATKYERAYFDKIVASLLPLLEKLTTGKAAALLSPDYLDPHDSRPIFSWRSVIQQKAVVVVGLDALADAPVSAAVGNSMLADLVSYLGERYKHGDSSGIRDGADDSEVKISLHADEVNELMGDEFIPMVNKGGGSGLQVTAYTQTLADVEAKVGSTAKSQQVTGNFNNLVMFRVKGIETARLLTDQLPQVSVDNLTWLAGYNDTSDPNSGIKFTSRHEDRVTTQASTMLEPHDVMKLPRGQAFALTEGGILSKLRLPLLKGSEISLSTDMARIASGMQANYRTGEHWWVEDDVC